MDTRLCYFVQPYVRRAGRLEAAPLERFCCAVEAEVAGERLSRRVAGVLVYMVEGDIEAGVWGEADVLARHGVLPDLTMAAA